MEKNIYCGRGKDVPYSDLMELINKTFGFETPETQFLGLLPKLYREERRPQDSNYVVIEGGVICAAVGAYDHTITVCGEELKCRGIGNVAVHPDHRSKGYMKMAMNAALTDMYEDEVDLSSLGGRRQRYQYFSYDRLGPCYHFTFNKDNLRHVFEDTTAPYPDYRAIEDANDPMLLQIHRLMNTKRVFSPDRPLEDLLDICHTWHCDLICVSNGNNFKGYAVMTKDGFITEIRTCIPEDFIPVLRSILVHSGLPALSVLLPPFETRAIADLYPICEGVNESCSMMYSVLNYEKVIRAFMRLKATYMDLPDGEITLYIDGKSRPERLRIAVKEGHVTVEPIHHCEAVDLALTHMNAMNLLFAPVSPLRNTLPTVYREWFPLPLWIYRADEV